MSIEATTHSHTYEYVLDGGFGMPDKKFSFEREPGANAPTTIKVERSNNWNCKNRVCPSHEVFNLKISGEAACTFEMLSRRWQDVRLALDDPDSAIRVLVAKNPPPHDDTLRPRGYMQDVIKNLFDEIAKGIAAADGRHEILGCGSSCLHISRQPVEFRAFFRCHKESPESIRSYSHDKR